MIEYQVQADINPAKNALETALAMAVSVEQVGQILHDLGTLVAEEIEGLALKIRLAGGSWDYVDKVLCVSPGWSQRNLGDRVP